MSLMPKSNNEEPISASKAARLQNRKNANIYRRMILREKHRTIGLSDKERGELAALEKIID